MHKAITLRANLALFLLFVGCGPVGQSSDNGDKDLVDAQKNLQASGNSSNAEGMMSPTAILANSIATKSLADGCTVDLIQDVTINPKEGSIQAMYSARMPKYADCAGTDKSAVLYIQSDRNFKIDDKYGCKATGGTFQSRCKSNDVKFSSTGFFQLMITGEGQFNPENIKMRMTYETR